MSSIGLNVLIINSDTKDHAKENGLADLWTRVITDLTLSIVLLSPEQLKSEEFARALVNNTFFARLYALAVDEMHLLLTWGRSFRKPFQQIGLVRSRLPDGVVLMGLTATMRGGTALKNICQFLGLKSGEYHLIRRSNQRHNIQLVFREITSPIEGSAFPELQWILRRNRKTVIFCHSISLGNRVHQFLYQCDKTLGGSPLDVLSRIREYNSLSNTYNETTRMLMQSGDCNIIIATSSLAVGVDIDNIEDVVVFGDPEDADQLLQMIGRIRPRYQQADDQSRYEGVVYFNSNARKRAEEALHTSSSMKAAMKSNGSDVGMDEGLAELYLSKCKIDGINKLYDNPQNDEPCGCPSCSMSPPSPRRVPCPCSGCMIKLFIPNIPSKSVQDVHVASAPKKHRGISLAMRSHGMNVLREFRQQIYPDDDFKTHMFPPSIFFTDDEMKKVLDNFGLLKEAGDVTNLLKGFKNRRLMPYGQQLFLRIEALKEEFQKIQADEKRQKESKNDRIQ